MAAQKTNYQLALEQLLLHEEQLDLIYNTVTDVLYMIDVEPDGRFKFVSVNKSFLTVTGLLAQDVIGKYIDQVIPPESINLVLGKYHEAINTASTVTWEEVSVYPLGTKYGLVTVTPVFDERGVCIRMIGSVHDVTEKKEQALAINKIHEEREKAISQLVRRNRDLEQYTYVVSHNLRAPIANIIGLVEILKSSDAIDAGVQSLVDDLSKSVANLDSVVIDLNRILQLREKNTENKEVVSLQQMIDDISISISDIIKSQQVTIKSDFDGRADIFSIRSHLYSIFYNLILNSIKYRRADVPPIIEIACFDSEDRTIVTFTDNGKGIDLAKHGEELFGLYKRFDTSVGGKGIGLFLVKTQVESLDGTITIESELKVGTRFTVVLPLTTEASV